MQRMKSRSNGRAWHDMLDIHADQVFTIGIINSTLQPVVVNNRLRNVPIEAFYNWSPGAYFGIHKPDTFLVFGKMIGHRSSAGTGGI